MAVPVAIQGGHANGYAFPTRPTTSRSSAVALADGGGGFWPAEIVHRVALACLAGEYASIVDAETTLAAARLAKTRLRSRTGAAAADE